MSTDGASAEQQSEEMLRSGEFSADRRFDPESLFKVIASTESADRAAEAMRMFVIQGDREALEQAIVAGRNIHHVRPKQALQGSWGIDFVS